MKAIVYTSNTGYTEKYAQLLAEETGLPVYSLEKAGHRLARGTEIIYLGWLMAGKIKGYAAASRRYRIAAVCGVGMSASGSQMQDLQKANKLPPELPLFTLQGGFDLQRLHGIYKLMMQTMTKTVGKGMAAKQNLSPEEDAMLELLLHGGDYVSRENLQAVLSWYQAQ